jgi:hypothetical protein
MKKLLITAASCILAAAPLRAQTLLGLASGLNVPVGDLWRIDNVGYHAMATLQSTPPLAAAGFRADAAYLSFSRKATIQDVDERIVAVGIGTLLRKPSLARNFSYLTGGIGVYGETTSPQASGSQWTTDLGVNVGAGARISLGSRRAFVEARYHHVFGSGGIRFVPVTVGLLF